MYLIYRQLFDQVFKLNVKLESVILTLEAVIYWLLFQLLSSILYVSTYLLQTHSTSWLTFIIDILLHDAYWRLRWIHIDDVKCVYAFWFEWLSSLWIEHHFCKLWVKLITELMQLLLWMPWFETSRGEVCVVYSCVIEDFILRARISNLSLCLIRHKLSWVLSVYSSIKIDLCFVNVSFSEVDIRAAHVVEQ